MKKLFIFGIGGLTGSKLAIIGKENFEVFGSYNFRDPKFDFLKSVKLDVKNFDKVKKVISEIKPDVVINACALNSVDYCENHQEEAQKVNVAFVKELNKFSGTLNFKIVQLSTDSVFDGTKKNSYYN